MSTADFDRKKFVEYLAAKAAADAADTLANYLQWKRPDLEESVASIRGLGDAIRRSLPESSNSDTGSRIAKP